MYIVVKEKRKRKIRFSPKNLDVFRTYLMIVILCSSKAAYGGEEKSPEKYYKGFELAFGEEENS